MAGIALSGKVLKKFDTVKVSETFQKRILWLEIDLESDYPQKVKIEFIKDKCSIIDKFSVGDLVEVDVNIRGNEGTLKSGVTEVFNQLNGWRVKGMASGEGQPSEQPSAPPTEQSPPPTGEDDGKDGVDDLPF